MRFAAVFLSSALLLVGSHAIAVPSPAWGAWKNARAGFPGIESASRIVEKLDNVDQLAEKQYKNQRMADYTESTLINLFDNHDIVPEEHEWGGPDRPFNLEEYFKISVPGTEEDPKKNGWQKFWTGVLGLFSPRGGITAINKGAGVRTTFATDGLMSGDNSEPRFDSTEDGSGTRDTAQENIDSRW